MRYTDPANGGWAMPTMATTLRLLPAGFQSRAYRGSDSAVFIVAEGGGQVEAGGERFDVTHGDVFAVPGWISYTLRATAPLVLFSFSDRAAQEKLGIFREQAL
jgi:gentisate 1,2-dioxygenase